jgi:hypothetical protein
VTLQQKIQVSPFAFCHVPYASALGNENDQKQGFSQGENNGSNTPPQFIRTIFGKEFPQRSGGCFAQQTPLADHFLDPAPGILMVLPKEAGGLSPPPGLKPNSP